MLTSSSGELFLPGLPGVKAMRRPAIVVMTFTAGIFLLSGLSPAPAGWLRGHRESCGAPLCCEEVGPDRSVFRLKVCDPKAPAMCSQPVNWRFYGDYDSAPHAESAAYNAGYGDGSHHVVSQI